MPNYKLSYFNVKGVAEPIRYILAWSGVQFEDDRISFEDWLSVKSSKPFGQLPCLDTGDSFILTQSVAIARYLARTLNLMGTDDLQNSQLDALVDHMKDLHDKHYKAEKFGAGSGMTVQEFENEVLPFFFTKFNAIASQGYFYGANVTWADIYFAGFIDTLETRMKKDLLDSYPNLNAIKSKINAQASIQSYLESRPFNSS